MKKSIYLIYISLLALWISCSKENPTAYEGPSGLYFWTESYKLPTDTLTQNDSITHTFVEYNTSVVRDTVYVVAQAVGFPTETNRPVNLRQTNAGDSAAAVAGVHYIPFEDTKELLYLAAGEVKAFLPVILLRDESLETTEYRLEIELVENDYFRPVPEELNSFLIKTSDMLAKPSIWDTRWRTYLGEWGPVKMRFLVANVTGSIDWESNPAMNAAYYYNALANVLLNEYNETHDEPMSEADGTPVSFPSL